MKKLLSILGTVALVGTVSINVIACGGGITSNSSHIKTQQDIIYVDENGNKQTTSDRDLSNLDTTEITQIGFYQGKHDQIQVVNMPIKIQKVPNQLPPEITSLSFIFFNDSAFNQDISK